MWGKVYNVGKLGNVGQRPILAGLHQFPQFPTLARFDRGQGNCLKTKAWALAPATRVLRPRGRRIIAYAPYRRCAAGLSGK